MDQLSRPDFQPRPIVGWPLPLLVRLDQALPGTLSRLLVGSPLRRATTFAVLAVVDLDAPLPPTGCLSRDHQHECVPLVRIAHAITRTRAREVLTAAYGCCPAGLLGALRRVGDDPLRDPVEYKRLFAIYSDPAQSRKAEALRHIERITSHTLDIVESVETDDLLTPDVMKKLASAPEAREIVQTIAYLTMHKAVDSGRLAEVISKIGAGQSLRRMIQNWVAKADLPVLVADLGVPDIQPLRTTAEMRAKAIEYRNCLKTRITDALVGRIAFIEIIVGRTHAIVELAPLRATDGTARWLIESVNTVANATIPAEISRAIRDRLLVLGCLERPRLPRESLEAGIGRVLGSWYGWDDDEEVAA